MFEVFRHGIHCRSNEPEEQLNIEKEIKMKHTIRIGRLPAASEVT